MNTEKNVKQQYVIPGGYGYAFHVKEGQVIIIKDLKGQQVVDFIAFSSENYNEYFSAVQTRTSPHQRYILKEGDLLLTNNRNPMAEIIEDTVGVHDLLLAACEPKYYEELGYPDHNSCHQNFAEVLAPYGIKSTERPDPFNIFQKTVLNREGTYFDDTPPSKAGDYIKLKFQMDALCAVSACPFDIDGFNDGKPTPIQINVD